MGINSKYSEPYFPFEVLNSELLGYFHFCIMFGQPGVAKKQCCHLVCQGGTDP